MLQWIILGFFLATMIWQVMKAIKKPMVKNIMTLIAIPISFFITLQLHKGGLFTKVITYFLEKFGLAENLANSMGEQAGAQVYEFINASLPSIAAVLAPALFGIVFDLVFTLSKLLYVNLITKYFKSREIKREKEELKKAIRDEKQRLAQTIRENEERNRIIIDSLSEEQQEEILEEYEPLDGDEIENMVEERVKKENKRRKKQGYYRESGERKAVSILAGLACGFLIFAINCIPLFYWMDIISDVTYEVVETDTVNNAESNTTIFNTVKLVDKYLVKDYENSPVIQAYENLGIIELFNKSVQSGTIIDYNLEGEPIYSNDVAKFYFSHTLRLSCALLDVNYLYREEDGIANDVRDIFEHDTYQKGVHTIAEFIATNEQVTAFLDDIISKDAVNEDGSINFGNAILKNIFGVYRNGMVIKDENGEEKVLSATDVIRNDLNTVSDVVIVIIKNNKLLSKITQDNMNALLGEENNKLLSDIIVALSRLSGYKPAMETTFTAGVEMIGKVEFFGLPKNKTDGYQTFINRVINAVGEVEKINDEDLAKLEELFINASNFEYNDTKIEYVQGKIDAIDAKLEVDGYVLTEEEIAQRAALEAQKAELIAERLLDENKTADKIGIFAYVLDPINVISFIQNDAKALIEDAKALKREADALTKDADQFTKDAEALAEIVERITNEATILSQSIASFTLVGDFGDARPILENEIASLNEQLSNEELTEEERLSIIEDIAVLQDLVDNGYASYVNEPEKFEKQVDALRAIEDRKLNAKGEFEEEVTRLENEAERLKTVAESLQNSAENLKTRAENLKSDLEVYSKKATERTEAFMPFVNYFMNWMNVQKPFMLAGEDKTTANLSMYIDGKLYVVNTDIINIEKLIDIVLNLNKEEEDHHEHVFVDGKCECGADEPHEHVFVDGKCECGADEPHEHVFVDGKCECGEEYHEHVFVDGKCECGEDELGDFIPSEIQEFLDLDIQKYLDEFTEKIPFADLLKQLNVTNYTDLPNEETEGVDTLTKQDFEGKVSPAADIISYLIVNAPGSDVVIDQIWLSTQLLALKPDANFVEPTTLVEEMLVVLGDASFGEQYYKELTLVEFIGSLNFDSWDNEEIKKQKLQLLTDLQMMQQQVSGT